MVYVTILFNGGDEFFVCGGGWIFCLIVLVGCVNDGSCVFCFITVAEFLFNGGGCFFCLMVVMGFLFMIMAGFLC